MNFKKIILTAFILVIASTLFAQKTAIVTDALKEYKYATELYKDKSYLASQQLFNSIKESFENSSELRANCEYYIANCAIRLNQNGADDLMLNFVKRYPTSTKQNNAFLETADYYFKIRKYSYALKWYKKANAANLSVKQKEEFNFKNGYALFATKHYKESKSFFKPLLDSPKYGSKAKYYYGYIAYSNDDYDTANDYLGQVSTDESYKKNVSYYLADINFKSGKFEKAIELGEPLLTSAKKTEHSQISKIVGESYFNLNKYAKAIPHLKNYKGTRGKWSNTDYYMLGYAYYKQNDYQNAISYFNKIINGDNAVAQNAYYHLAECYLKLNKKSEALNAFRNASQMEFVPKIQEDAFLNYAKISYQIGNPYKSVPEVLQDYLKKYPKSIQKKEIETLIVSSFLTSEDYAGAIEYLEKKKQTKNNTFYQKATFFRGIELFNDKKYKDAILNFNKTIAQNTNQNIATRALFWKAEANFRLNNFNDAFTNFNLFKNNAEAKNTEEYKNINYQIAYTLFKQKEYTKAGNEFNSYIHQNPEDTKKLNDSYLRLSDTYFVTSNYNDAINTYNKIIQNKGAKADYAQFQKAISLGFIHQDAKKIAELNTFISKYPTSKYRDDAYYVLANEYVDANKNNEALKKYDYLINHFKRSPLVAKAMLKKGVVYYNTDKNEEALTTYKKIVTKFPNTAEAKQAITSARQIYVDLGRVDEYANWVKGIDFINVTNADLDNDMYESAEKQYLLSNHKKAILGFKKYLNRFENGLHALQAHFYLAEAYYSEKQSEKTILHYQYVVNKQSNEFTEQALTRLAQAYLEADNWQKAIPILERLENESLDAQNTIFAQTNLMKGYYKNENYNKAVTYAEKVLSKTSIDNKIKSDAQIIIARSAFETEDFTKARNAYKLVETIATGKLKAEALYFDALFEHQDGNYNASNTVVQKIASQYASYKYWGGKSLIIMAKNHYQLKDSFQATYILESVIKNFSQFDDIVEEAKKELTVIKKEEAKTNNSVIPEN